MLTSSVSSASSSTALASNAASSASSTDPAAAQDRFLKLLVAQLNNQDPMNPMDNAQMTSQMAQINTVSGISQLNQTLKSMSDQFAAMQVLQGAAMVGREVLLEGSTLSASAGTVKGAVDLGGAADSVKIDILSPAGQVIDSLNLGPQTAGRVAFEWDASAHQGSGAASFKVTATRAAQAVSATPLVQDKVLSVGSDNGAMTVQLAGRPAVAYSAIKAIL